MMVQAFEHWLDEPVPSEAYAEEDLESLGGLHTGFELLHRGPHTFSKGAGNGYSLTFRHLDEDQEPIVVHKIYATQGPLLVEMFLQRPDEDVPQKASMIEGIAKTFELQGSEMLVRAEPFALLHGAEEVEIDATARQAFPRCCVSLPQIPGWDLVEQDGQAVYTQSGSEIRLQRLVQMDPDAGQWFSERLARLQASHSTLFGSQQGELSQGWPFSALHFEERGETRRWKTAAVERQLEVAFEGEQLLLASLRCKEAKLTTCRQALAAVLNEINFLPPEQWVLHLPTEWLPLRLEGGWRVEGPGIYYQLDDETILQTNQDVSRAPLVDLKDSILESHRTTVDPKQPSEEDETQEKQRGAQILRYRIDGRAPTGEPLSLRSLWCTHQEQLYSAVVLARNTDAAQRHFASIPSALELPS